MELKRYENHELIHINRWLAKRLLPLVKESDIPENGYIAYNNDIPVSAAFLRKCEGNIAIIDSLITDPEAPSEVRHVAIDSITENLIRVGSEMGLKAIICFSVDASTILRAKKHGFKETMFIPMVKNFLEDK